MGKEDKITGSRFIVGLIVLLGGATLTGCSSGNGSHASSAAARSVSTAASSTTAAKRPWPTQNAAAALAACKSPVERAPSLSAEAKSEITVLCVRMDERVKENAAIMRAVCQELASATSSGASDAKRIYSECFAGYAKTVLGANRRGLALPPTPLPPPGG